MYKTANKFSLSPVKSLERSLEQTTESVDETNRDYLLRSAEFKNDIKQNFIAFNKGVQGKAPEMNDVRLFWRNFSKDGQINFLKGAI